MTEERLKKIEDRTYALEGRDEARGLILVLTLGVLGQDALKIIQRHIGSSVPSDHLQHPISKAAFDRELKRVSNAVKTAIET